MADLLELLRSTPAITWLRHSDRDRFDSYFSAACAQLPQPGDSPAGLRIALAIADPVRFLASFCAIHTAGHSVFLCNPSWGSREWQQVQAIVRPHVILGNCPLAPVEGDFQPADLPPFICIPTGGSSGSIEFAAHTWATLTAAAQAFQQHFDRSPICSVCLLPLFHVSGFMQFVRSLLTGGELFIGQSKRFLAGGYLDLPATDWFISLIPTQLRRALAHPDLVTWLAHCEAILLGGAPAWPSLLERARRLQLPLAPTYGATETAAQVATLLPRDFLTGLHSGVPPLPHASIQILDDCDRPLPSNADGRIAVLASSLAWGYYPELQWGESSRTRDGWWMSDDLGYLDDGGFLHVLGRSSTKIVTGGENVFPNEVEAAIRGTQRVDDVAVLGMPDEDWGEVVVAICVLGGARTTLEEIAQLLTHQLARYKHPRRWLALEALPRNNRGKIDRHQLRHLARGAHPL